MAFLSRQKHLIFMNPSFPCEVILPDTLQNWRILSTGRMWELTAPRRAQCSTALCDRTLGDPSTLHVAAPMSLLLASHRAAGATVYPVTAHTHPSRTRMSYTLRNLGLTLLSVCLPWVSVCPVSPALPHRSACPVLSPLSRPPPPWAPPGCLPSCSPQHPKPASSWPRRQALASPVSWWSFSGAALPRQLFFLLVW